MKDTAGVRLTVMSEPGGTLNGFAAAPKAGYSARCLASNTGSLILKSCVSKPCGSFRVFYSFCSVLPFDFERLPTSATMGALVLMQ